MQSKQPFLSKVGKSFDCQLNDDTRQEEQIEFWGHSWQKLTPKQRQFIKEILNDNPITMNPNSSLFELPGKEVLGATGLYRNPVTKAVWCLSIEDRRLTINVPNFSFQLSPLSATKFRPVDPSINLEFEFATHNQSPPCLLHIYAKGIKRASFQAL